jgi:pyruvate formate lyase activating enzyme
MGTVFNIQHFSIKDGTGIRTVVFLKGCPLRCKWCANPESQERRAQLAWTASSCIGCKYCEQKLTEHKCHFTEKGLEWNDLVVPDPERIDRTCASTALHVIGKEMTAEEVLYEVQRDLVFYDSSQGGLTISGGEPLMQPDFTLELIREAHKRGIHCTMECSGYGKAEKFIRIAEELDYLYMDIKSMNSKKHRAYTGVANERILDNIKQVKKACPKLPTCIRTPVIPGFNDTPEDILAIKQFVDTLPSTDYELLKYHKLGMPKYESLRREYPMGDVALEDGKFEELQDLIALNF